MTQQGQTRAGLKEITDEVIEVRKRGVDRLDIDTPQQPRKNVPNLERLAREYCEAVGEQAAGRIAQITKLLRDSLVAYGERENPATAEFIKDLFFDPPGKAVPQPPSRRREAAMKAHAGPDDTFDASRRRLFEAFARFLMNFVEEVKARPPQPVDDPARKTATRALRERPSSYRLAAAAGLAVLIIGAGLAVLLTTRGNSTTGSRPPGTPGATFADSGTVPTGKTYAEIAGNRNGSPVFNDPQTPSRTMPDVPFMQKVEVSCRVYAPSLESVTWWYRLASPPYNNVWWSPAVTYLNGDKVEGPYEHDVDEQVPEC